MPARLASGLNGAFRAWLDLSGPSTGGVTSGSAQGTEAPGQEQRLSVLSILGLSPALLVTNDDLGDWPTF